jgi:hypothetical protein
MGHRHLFVCEEERQDYLERRADPLVGLILIVANDLEQSLARVFRTMEGIIEHNPELKQEAEV